MAWLSGWSYRKTVSITGQTGAGTDYQVDFSIGDAAGGDFNVESHCTSFPNDIQVTDNDQTTTLDYWVEDLTVDPITMWTEVADDLGSNVDVCVYYGKSGESSAANGDNTFTFFDDFLGTSLNLDKWTETSSGGSYTVLDSVLTVKGPATENVQADLEYAYPLVARFGGLYVSSVGVNSKYMGAGLRNLTSGYVMLMQQRHIYGDLYVTYDGTIYTDAALTGFNSTHNYEIRWKDGTEVKFYQDDVYDTTMTSGVTTDNKGALFTVDGGAVTSSDWVKCDWVAFRKYLSPTEPAFSSAGSEESAAAATIPVFMHTYRNLRET